MKIYIGADHRGYSLKEKIKIWLSEWNQDYEDMGAHALSPHDDYPIYAEKVGSLVGKEEGARGILLCGSGVGVDVAANKFDGVRASIGITPEQVVSGRGDDDMNILVLAADFTNENQAKEILKVFLETKFEVNARHKRRLADIKKIEANN